MSPDKEEPFDRERRPTLAVDGKAYKVLIGSCILLTPKCPQTA